MGNHTILIEKRLDNFFAVLYNVSNSGWQPELYEKNKRVATESFCGFDSGLGRSCQEQSKAHSLPEPLSNFQRDFCFVVWSEKLPAMTSLVAGYIVRPADEKSVRAKKT